MSGLIKNIQNVTVTIAAGATSGTQAVTAGTLANMVVWSVSATDPSTGSLNPANAKAGVALTSNVQLTATRNTSDASNAVTVYVCVVEFQPGVLASNQAFTTTMTASGSQTQAITAVTLANSCVLWNGNTTTYTLTNAQQIEAAVSLTSTTQATVTRSGGTSNVTVYYTVVEFNAGILQSSTQQSTVAVTSATSGTTTITDVTAANSLIAYGGQTQTNSNPYGQLRGWMTITNGTTVTMSRGDSGASTTTGFFTVVEFKAADVKSNNSGSLAIATGTTTNTATITAVVAANTIVSWMGSTTNTTGALASDLLTGATLNSTTQVGVFKGASSASVTATIGYMAFEFQAFVPSSSMFLVM